MKAIFLGTPASAVPALAALTESAEVVAVVTQPDRPRGRSKAPMPSPVKEAARVWGLPVSQPVSRTELADAVVSHGPIDVAVLVAYGRLIPEDVLTIPYRGFVNVHFSLLPRWRGASPIVRAILSGDTETGVSLMQLDAGLDTGPVIAAEATDIRVTDTAGSLTARLAHRGAALLARHLASYVEGALRPRVQDDELATAAGKVATDEAHINPVRHSATSVERAVRAFDPKPGAWSVFGDRVKLWATGPAESSGPEPGVVDTIEGRVLLGCRDGAVELRTVQPSGKARMSAADWVRGRGTPIHYSG